MSATRVHESRLRNIIGTVEAIPSCVQPFDAADETDLLLLAESLERCLGEVRRLVVQRRQARAIPSAWPHDDSDGRCA